MPQIYFDYRIGDRVFINKEKTTGKIISIITYNHDPWKRFLVKLDGPGGRVGEEYLFVDSELKLINSQIKFKIGDEVMLKDDNGKIGIVVQINEDLITNEIRYKVKIKGENYVRWCRCHSDELKKIDKTNKRKPKFKLEETIKLPYGSGEIIEILGNGNGEYEYLVKIGILQKWFKEEQLEKISQLKSVNNEKKAKIEKPPLGLMPKNVWEMRRRETIANAIARYTFANETIPKEWIEEYNELISKIVSK